VNIGVNTLNPASQRRLGLHPSIQATAVGTGNETPIPSRGNVSEMEEATVDVQAKLSAWIVVLAVETRVKTLNPASQH
jgi:hypothetical protein